MRKVYGVEVTCITRGDPRPALSLHPGHGKLETDCLNVWQNQQKPYELD